MTTNPNNYEGAQTTIVGKAGGAPVPVFDGTSTQLSVAVPQGYKDKQTDEWVDKGTVWYTGQANTDYAEQNWPEIEAGDKVRIDDAKQEIRVYLKNNGDPGVEVKLTFGKVTVIERKRDRVAASGSKPF